MRRTRVVDLGVDYSVTQTLLKYLYARKRRGRWGSVYQWSPRWDRMIQKRLERSRGGEPGDGVMEGGDLARLDAPFYVYQDLSFEVLERYYDEVSGVPGFKGIDLDTIRRRKERQHGIYESATGIFAMSQWFADALTRWSGVPREKITVVHAGIGSPEVEEIPDPEALPERPPRRPPKLLFVGRDFFRKGGESVVQALAELRREYSPGVTLTVAGPERWPMTGKVPEGVEFVGERSPAEVTCLYREHDLFVLPSRFEAFGIVFREALANGLPAIGRAEFAMPEIIEPGKNGALVNGDDPAELAAAIVAVLEDPAVRQYTARTAKDVRERFSWDAVAGRMLNSIEPSTQSPIGNESVW